MKKILVVDDHGSIRQGIKLLFESRGKSLDYQVVEAAHGKEALDIIKDDVPDLAIVDLMMPEMDGFTLCNEIKKMHNHLPVIILTAKTDPQTADKVNLLYKPDKFLTKPIDNHVLFNEAKDILEKS